MKSLDFKDKKVKGALVIVGACLALVFLYFNLFGMPEGDKRNDKKIENGESASYLNFNVPNINDSGKDQDLSTAYEQNLRDSIDNAKKNADAITYAANPNSNYQNASKDNFSDSDFESLRRSAISNSQKTNSHSTYGTRDMWSNNSDVNVGYSDMGNVIDKPTQRNSVPRQTQPKQSKVSNYETQPNTVAIQNESYGIENSSLEPKKIDPKTELERKRKMLQTGSRNIENTAQFKANIDGMQTIKNGGSVKLKTMEAAIINGTLIPKYSTLYGIVSFGDNRVNIDIRTVRTENAQVNCNLSALGVDGLKGIAVSLESLSGINDATQQVIDQGISKSGIGSGGVGSIITNIFRSNRKNEIKVKVLNNQNLILVQQ